MKKPIKILAAGVATCLLSVTLVQAPANAFTLTSRDSFTTTRLENSFIVGQTPNYYNPPVEDEKPQDDGTTVPSDGSENNTPPVDPGTPSDSPDDNYNTPEQDPVDNNDSYINTSFDRYSRRTTRTPLANLITVPSTPTTPSQPGDTVDTGGNEAPADGETNYEMPEAPAGLTADEAKAFEMINEFRIANGKAPVEINMQVVELARKKALDLVENDYFDHISPTYGSPKQMVTAAGISAGLVGENLSKAGNIVKAQVQLQVSTHGHREILLRSRYTQVGVGVVELKNSPGVMLVEIFIEPK